MSKNITAIILIVLAVGIYFTFTKAKIDELTAIQAVNTEYKNAIDNAALLLKARDKVVNDDINISDEDNMKLSKILPNNVDNVRLIIDVKDNVAARHGLFLKSIRTSSPDEQAQGNQPIQNRGVDTTLSNSYGTVEMSFGITTTYQKFIDFMKDLETSLRVMDVTRFSVSANDTGTYDFNVALKTYWLKQ